uniref:ecto-ADP-ribosyltransferase 4-like isoform X1 n=2 Tax=Semicossyphus pulcher TaxID=241346 RepID=UPI0037E817F2
MGHLVSYIQRSSIHPLFIPLGLITDFFCSRCTMPSWERQQCHRETLSACAITSLVLLAGLLMFVVIFLTLGWQDIVEEHSQDPTHDLPDHMYDDCGSKATVLTDEAIMQKWDASKNLSEAWRKAEQKASAPAHIYMGEHHSIAIYMYTNLILQPVKRDTESAERTVNQPKETFESLYSSLSEAVQILKHSQVTCLSTTYRTDTLLSPNVSDKLVRFSTFMLTSDWWNSTRNTSCFEVYTCFGANITHYSALQLHSHVLIPPYETFIVTDIMTDTRRCKFLYKLKSNLNCVYDRESNMLHPISAITVDQFWLIFTITCIIIVSLLLPFVIVKVMENRWKRAIYSV